MYLPEVPAHVVQRGNNRSACFFTDEDYLFYLDCLGQGLRRYRVKLHAYVLMTNHVHLLLTPADASGISLLMQHLARLYVLYINRTYRRSGTLWEGRHKASLVQVETFMLTCYRYIEMNPVAAGMVERPEDYRWSSYAWHGWGRPDRLITDHSSSRLSRATPKNVSVPTVTYSNTTSPSTTCTKYATHSPTIIR